MSVSFCCRRLADDGELKLRRRFANGIVAAVHTWELPWAQALSDPTALVNVRSASAPYFVTRLPITDAIRSKRSGLAAVSK
jgi:hypothetical protein